MPKALLIFAGISLTVLCWGSYGPVLHKGQAGLDHDRFKPLICVGLAYLLVAILVPMGILASLALRAAPYYGGKSEFTSLFTASSCGKNG